MKNAFFLAAALLSTSAVHAATVSDDETLHILHTANVGEISAAKAAENKGHHFPEPN